MVFLLAGILAYFLNVYIVKNFTALSGTGFTIVTILITITYILFSMIVYYRRKWKNNNEIKLIQEYSLSVSGQKIPDEIIDRRNEIISFINSAKQKAFLEKKVISVTDTMYFNKGTYRLPLKTFLKYNGIEKVDVIIEEETFNDNNEVIEYSYIIRCC